MASERVLSLDISTKTGYALLISNSDGTYHLEKYGQIPQVHQPDGSYPSSFVTWASTCFEKIREVIDETNPDVLIIEETSAGSKAIYTQKILEWIHYLMATMITHNKWKVVYTLTEQWRRETGCLMTKEESKRNKEVRAYKKKKELETGTKTTVARDKNGKRIGLINRKHVNIRKANEIFGEYLKEPLKRKDEDTADSLLIAFSYHIKNNKR